MELVLTFHYDTAFKQHFSYNEVIQSTALTYDLVVFFPDMRIEDQSKRHLLDCLSLNVYKWTQDVSGMKRKS